MAVTIEPISEGNAVRIAITDKLHKEDYQAFVPRLEKMIQEKGKVRVLFDMHNFHGWDTAALWEDIKFDAKHFRDFEKIAMVGEKTWEKWMSAFCNPFTTGKIKYFDQAEKDEAMTWIVSD